MSKKAYIGSGRFPHLRYTGGGVSAPPPPPGPIIVDKRKPTVWGLDISRTTSQRGLSTVAQRQLASQFDGWIHSISDYDDYMGGGGSQFSGTVSRLTATCDYILNDVTNPYRNPTHKSVIYQIDSETAAAEIVTLVRSGTTLTMTFDRDPPGLVLSGAVSLGQGLKLRLLPSPYHVFNGDYTTSGTGTAVIGTLVSYDMATRTLVCTVANSGPTSTDTSRTGVAIARSRGLWRFEQVCSMNAWVYRLGTSGRRFTWTNSFGTYDVNCTEYTPTASGLTFSEHIIDKDHATGLGTIPGLAGYFQDNVNSIRVDPNGAGDIGDWDRDGVAENRNGSLSISLGSVQASHRAGKIKFANRVRFKNAAHLVIANADTDLSASSWTGAYDGAILEHGHRQTTATCVARTAQINHLRGQKIAIYCAASESDRGRSGLETDYNFMRRNFARSLVVGFPAYAFTGDSYLCTVRHDEMDAPLGLPVDAKQVAARSGTLWYREFTNGVVVFNDGTSSATLSLQTAFPGKSFRKISAADIGRPPLDSFNNGAAVTSITLAGATGTGSTATIIGEGCILIRSDT